MWREITNNMGWERARVKKKEINWEKKQKDDNDKI